MIKKGSFSTKNSRNWALLLGALGFTGYGAYRVYHLPSAVHKRKKLMKLFGTLISIAEAAHYSAEAIGVVSKDINVFLKSNSDQIPNGLRQVSKITRSEEFSESVIGATRALSVGIMRGYRKHSRDDDETGVDSSFPDWVLDKLFSKAGSGLASVVVGSFAKNLAMAFYTNNSTNPSVSDWANLLCDDKFRELIFDCIKLFVGTAVAVYLDKTMHINPFQEIFSGLTNPRHETKTKDLLTSVCNGAVETLIRTSNQVLTNDNSIVDSNHFEEFQDAYNNNNEEVFGGEEEEPPLNRQKAIKSFEENVDGDDGWWVNEFLFCVLGVPSNRKFVLDVTGLVTFETVSYFLECLVEKLFDGVVSCFNGVYDVVVEKGLGILRFVTVKSFSFVTICVSLCLYILGGAWVLVPA
ncbi:hypothetical protein U1Q18_039086 [Sarracenia purpurea var. burkii]